MAHLPAFASVEDLEARMGDVDDARAQAALDDASAFIRAEAGKDWAIEDALDDDVPDVIVAITLKAARRALENPEGVTKESVGTYSVGYANSSSDVYLSSEERRLIRRAAGKSGLWTQATTRSDPATAGLDTPGPPDYVRCGVADTYLPVEPPGAPIPFE